MHGSGWSHFAHGADIGVAGAGPTKAEAFRQAALALTAVVVDPATVRPREMFTLTCHAPYDDLLLVDWLNALIYEMSVRRMVFGDFAVRVDGGTLEAVVRGEPVDPARHEPAVEVKGATMTALRVWQGGGLWHAECVVDV